MFLFEFLSDIVWWRFFLHLQLSKFLSDMAGSISKDSEVQIFREDQVKINTFAKKNHKLQVSLPSRLGTDRNKQLDEWLQYSERDDFQGELRRDYNL